MVVLTMEEKLTGKRVGAILLGSSVGWVLQGKLSFGGQVGMLVLLQLLVSTAVLRSWLQHLQRRGKRNLQQLARLRRVLS